MCGRPLQFPRCGCALASLPDPSEEQWVVCFLCPSVARALFVAYIMAPATTGQGSEHARGSWLPYFNTNTYCSCYTAIR